MTSTATRCEGRLVFGSLLLPQLPSPPLLLLSIGLISILAYRSRLCCASSLARPQRFPNNDGFDPVSCVNVTLVNSRIDVADDGVCPKADASMGPLVGLHVKNVTIRSKSHAIKFGSNTDLDMRDCLFENITIWDSNGGLSIQQRSGGDISNVTFSNIKVETRLQAPRWWGNGDWLSVNNNPRGNGETIGTISNLHFINITGRSEGGGLLSGISGLSDVSFENVFVKIEAWSNYSDGSGPPCYEDAPSCSNMTGAEDEPPQPSEDVVCVAHPLPTDTEMGCLGQLDYRPTPGSDALEGTDGYYARVGVGRADALFVENGRSVRFENVAFEFESPRKPWFGDCLRIDDNSAAITGAEGVQCTNGP